MAPSSFFVFSSNIFNFEDSIKAAASKLRFICSIRIASASPPNQAFCRRVELPDRYTYRHCEFLSNAFELPVESPLVRLSSIASEPRAEIRLNCAIGAML